MSGVTLERTDDALEVSLGGSGGRFQDNLTKVKEAGARFDAKRKLWLLPPEPKYAERIIHTLEPEVDPSIIQWIKESKQTDEQDLVSHLPDDNQDLMIPWATKRMPYQPEKVNDERFMGLKAHQRSIIGEIAHDGEVRAIVADDMGLGKSATAISIIAESYMQRNKDDIMALTLQKRMGPILVVCPNSVKGVWKREVERWLGPYYPAVVIDAAKPEKREQELKDAIDKEAFVIINYEQLRIVKEKVKTRNGGTKVVKKMKQSLFETTKWAAVIADECHRAKNRKAAQTMGLYKVKAPIMLAMSGTPLMNSPDDLWSILHWLFPDEYKSYWRFFEEHVDYVEGYFKKDIVGVKNPDGLRYKLHNRLYRRTKGQVLDLPEKQRITVPVDLDTKSRKVYTEAERSLWVELEKAVQEGDKQAAEFAQAATERFVYQIPNGAARTVRLRQILSNLALLGGDDHSNKMDALMDKVLDASHKQHVVFCEFVESCELLAGRLDKAGVAVETYTGETEQRDRGGIEDKFQAGNIDVLVGTIGAMREGITLTAADTEHFLERAWVPAWNQQAEDRCHRIGQSNPVTIYIYQGVDSVDDGTIHITNLLKNSITKTVLPQDYVKET